MIMDEINISHRSTPTQKIAHINEHRKLVLELEVITVFQPELFNRGKLIQTVKILTKWRFSSFLKPDWGTKHGKVPIRSMLISMVFKINLKLF